MLFLYDMCFFAFLYRTLRFYCYEVTITRNWSVAKWLCSASFATPVSFKCIARTDPLRTVKWSCWFIKSSAVAERLRDVCAVKILLSYSRSCKINSVEKGGCKFLLILHCNCVSILYRFWSNQRRLMAFPWMLAYGSFAVFENGIYVPWIIYDFSLLL